MTIDSIAYKVSAHNLYEKNDILNLTPSNALSQPIASVSFVAARHSIQIPWPDVLLAAIHAMADFLENSPYRERRWLFFGASDIWRTPSAVTNHRKFWGANKTISHWNLKNKSPEVLFSRDSVVRYAVCAEVPREAVADFGEWCRATRSGLMLLQDSVAQQTENNVKEYFERTFLNGNNDVDWNNAVAEFCTAGSILTRFSGAFDDPDAAVDLIYNPRYVCLN